MGEEVISLGCLFTPELLPLIICLPLPQPSVPTDSGNFIDKKYWDGTKGQILYVPLMTLHQPFGIGSLAKLKICLGIKLLVFLTMSAFKS